MAFEVGLSTGGSSPVGLLSKLNFHKSVGMLSVS